MRYVDGLHGRIPLTFTRVSELRVAFDYMCIFLLILYNEHLYCIDIQIILRGLMILVVHFDEIWWAEDNYIECLMIMRMMAYH